MVWPIIIYIDSEDDQNTNTIPAFNDSDWFIFDNL